MALICEVVENRSTVVGSRRVEDPNILRQFVTVVYSLPCGKVWLSLLSEVRVRSPAMKKCRIFRGWVKTPVLFLAISGPKFMKFWIDVVLYINPKFHELRSF